MVVEKYEFSWSSVFESLVRPCGAGVPPAGTETSGRDRDSVRGSARDRDRGSDSVRDRGRDRSRINGSVWGSLRIQRQSTAFSNRCTLLDPMFMVTSGSFWKDV